MESTGLPNKMHISKETADLLKAAGKKWAKKREDKVYAKGKGELETYWLAPGKTVSVGSMSSSASSSEGENEGDAGELKTMPILKSRNGMSNTLMNTNSEKSLRRSSHHLRRSSHADKKNSLHGSSKKAKENAKKNGRLIQWNAEVLVRLLKQIKARREAIEQTTGEEAGADSKLDDDDDDNSSNLESILTEETDDSNDDDEFGGSETKTTVFEEIKEIIHLPVFKPRAASTQQDITDVEIDKKARDQCQEFVREVAAMYRWNPFHNFVSIWNVEIATCSPSLFLL